MTKTARRICPDFPILGRRLARQWAIYRELVATPEGATIKELVDATGVADKTVRRALIIFREIGIPVVETIEAHGRKAYRIGHPFEATTDRRGRYRLVRDSLRELISQAEMLGDPRLTADLKAVERRLKKKGQDKRSKAK